MKVFFLLWLFSLLLPAAQAENRKSHHQSDAQTIAAFAEKGWCFNYGGFWQSENTLAPCRKYCETHQSGPLNDISCLSFGVSFKEMKEMGLSYLDDSGHEFVTGECRCDLDGLGKVIIDTLVSGLARLDDVLCGVLVTTFETILDAGLVALPVGQIKRLETFIRAAKTVTENGLDAGVFFGSWANPICGKGWDKPSEDHVFAELAQAPDEYGSSLGCKRMEGCPESHNQRRGLDKDPTTSPICKPGKGVGGCSACSNVQAWPPGYFKEDGRGEDDDDEAAHLAIRGTGFFGWESPSLERRAKKSTTSTSTPSSTSGSLTATSSTSTQTGIPTPPVLKPSKKGKKVQFCSMMTQTALYPGPAKLIGHKNVRVNATYALKDPRECGDFNILRRPNSRYKLDYKSLNSPKHHANYGLATEHVLETQLINLFSAAISKQEGEIFENPYDSNSAKMVDFCTYMKAYWDDNDKNTLPNIGGTSRLAIQWIADQFPTTKFQENEFFLLPGAPNGVKGRAWGGDSIYTADTKASLKNKDFLTNSKLQESELVKTIIRFKDVMFAYKYMAMNDVQSALKEQAHRISNALGELDIATEAIDFEKLTKTIIRNYVYRDLQKKWDKWIKEHTKDTIEKVEKFFDEQYGHYTKARAELEKDLKAAIEAAEKEEKDDKSKKLNQTAADAKKAKHKAEKERYETVI
ncbi:hypothetical protein H109_03738 [Trichophyton interdigitale MR816]|uniref:Uncharacterized protein n=1 Tax=Trichophyton interdigitale (strain MR816) TaxID=1215338 RepID=A0A059J960_TRIIM|nr:hypothetical protein H109_03738 [Trichophyton interdigitale MR816]